MAVMKYTQSTIDCYYCLLYIYLHFFRIRFFCINIMKCTKDHKSQRSIKILLFTIKTIRLQTFYCCYTYGVASFVFLSFFLLLRLFFFLARLWRRCRCRWCSRRTLFFIVCNVFKVIINKVHSRVWTKEMQRTEMKWEIECIMKYFHFFRAYLYFIGQCLIIQFFFSFFRCILFSVLCVFICATDLWLFMLLFVAPIICLSHEHPNDILILRNNRHNKSNGDIRFFFVVKLRLWHKWYGKWKHHLHHKHNSLHTMTTMV